MQLRGASLVLFLTLSLLNTAATQSTPSVSEQTATGTSLDSPIPFGQAATIPPGDISLRMVSVDFDASPEAVVNESDEEGLIDQPGYTAVRVVVDFMTNEGSRSPNNASDDVRWDVVGPAGLGYDATRDYSCGDEGITWDRQQDVYAGGTDRVAFCFIVPIDETKNAVLVAYDHLGSGEPVYFSLEDTAAATPGTASPAATPND